MFFAWLLASAVICVSFLILLCVGANKRISNQKSEAICDTRESNQCHLKGKQNSSENIDVEESLATKIDQFTIISSDELNNNLDLPVANAAAYNNICSTNYDSDFGTKLQAENVGEKSKQTWPQYEDINLTFENEKEKTYDEIKENCAPNESTYSMIEEVTGDNGYSSVKETIACMKEFKPSNNPPPVLIRPRRQTQEEVYSTIDNFITAPSGPVRSEAKHYSTNNIYSVLEEPKDSLSTGNSAALDSKIVKRWSQTHVITDCSFLYSKVNKKKTPVCNKKFDQTRTISLKSFSMPSLISCSLHRNLRGVKSESSLNRHPVERNDSEIVSMIASAKNILIDKLYAKVNKTKMRTVNPENLQEKSASEKQKVTDEQLLIHGHEESDDVFSTKF